MKNAKKLCALLTAVILLLTAGCVAQSEGNNDASGAADLYIEKAQKYVDEQNYAAAIDILKLGIETVDDDALEEMLDEVIELQIAHATEDEGQNPTENEERTNDITAADQPVFDLSKYESSVTYWATEGMDWVYGGYALGIYTGESFTDSAYFEFSYLQGAPSSRNAVASAEINLSEITSDEVTFSFEDDGWGHSGKVKLIFADNSIYFTVSDVAYTDPSCPDVWGFYDTSGMLVSNPTVYDDLYYTQEEYDALFGGPDYASQEPVYDTSKASGILASLGMTEQEFRDSCIPLDTGSINSKTTAYYVDCDELLRYPNNYVGQHFVICNNYHDYLPCQYCNGIDDSCAYSSDFPPQRYDENGLHWVYQSDLTMLVPESFSFYNEGVSSDGYPLYSLYVRKPYCYIFDMRDDIYSPNIATDASVTPYLIFLGLTSDGTDLRFAMITCDVTFD